MSDIKRWVVTGTSMVVEAETPEEAIERAEQSSGWHWEAEEVDTHPEHEECWDGCGLAVTHNGPCRERPGGRVICEHPEVDGAACIAAGEHQRATRHRWQECPTYHENEE